MASDAEVIWFGHIGDGNVHLNILKPIDQPIESFKAACEPLGDAIMGVVQQFGGSVSAEHGVGLLKNAIFNIPALPLKSIRSKC